MKLALSKTRDDGSNASIPFASLKVQAVLTPGALLALT